MDPYDFPVTRSPRKELQGPRPPALKVRKDSHKIKKPPMVPQSNQQNQPPTQPRQPVIIYTVSPKVIHTNPSEFMNLVQRLTGSSSSSTSSTISSNKTITNPSINQYSAPNIHNNNPFNDFTSAVSPAARFATLEKAKSPKETNSKLNGDFGFIEGIEMSQVLEKSLLTPSGNLFPGILSPGPNSLPQISPTFFSPPSDPNMLSFLHDLSPIVHGNKNFLEGSFMPSPSTNFISPRFMMTSSSPNTSMDIFNNFNNFFDY